MVQPPKNLKAFESFLEVVAALRGPDGCPWDKEQTHRSLTPYAIEEAHELAEAIENGDRSELVSELGDLLLQVVLHAEIGKQAGSFDIFNVIEGINSKMVRRHPHVFGNTQVAHSEEVLKNWSEIKAQEKKHKPGNEETRFDIPVSIPALTRAQKIGEKTKRLRFDWTKPVEVLGKVDEELDELKAEMNASPKSLPALEHEIGDLLFSIAQLARHLGLEAEQCLRTANSRFESRFFNMRKHIQESGQDYDRLSLEELEQAWQSTKEMMAKRNKNS